MKYTAIMGGTGREIPIEISDAGLNVDTISETCSWITDDNGVMLNMRYVAALVPADAPVQIDYPRKIRDGEGNLWRQVKDDDRYRCVTASHPGMPTMSQIADEHNGYTVIE